MTFRRTPGSLAALLLIALVALVAIAAPIAFGQAATSLHLDRANKGPSSAHLLGTDALGRDLLLRMLVATRLSIELALAATAIGAGIGITFGALTGIAPGGLRTVVQRAIDSLLAFPVIIVAIFVGAILGPGALGATLGVGIALSFSFARVASTLAISIGGRDYIAAARVLGVSPWRRFTRYILPNIADPLIIQTTVAISNSIVFVSALSFLGLGVQAPAFDWGQMLTQGVQAFYTNAAAALGPAAAIAITALAAGFAGEALTRAANPLLTMQTASSRKGRSRKPVRGARAALGLRENGQVGKRVVAVEDLRVLFPGTSDPTEVVSGVSFGVDPGEIVGIVGESGSGKTMTALALAQLIPPTGEVTGRLHFNGHDLADLKGRSLARLLGTKMAVIFQDPMLSLNPALRIGTQVTEGARVHRGLSRKAARQEGLRYLDEVSMPRPEVQFRRYSHELSGGMRQRVMIAGGLINEPSLLIADEPTTALDVTIQAQIMDLLGRINRDHGTAIVLISHNLALVQQNCRRVLVMYAGRIVEDLPADRVLEDALHPYTRALIGCLPIPGQVAETLTAIPGVPPDPADLPSGCAFEPRCPLARAQCVTEEPPLVTVGSGRRVACWVAMEKAG